MKNFINYILGTFLIILIHILLFVFGAFLFIYPQTGLKTAQFIFIAFLFIKSIGEFWNYFIQYDMGGKSRLFQGIGFLVVAIIVLINHNLRIVSLSLLLSGVFFFDAVLKFLVALQYKKSGLSNWWHSLIMSVVSVVLMVLFWQKDSYLMLIRMISLFICFEALSTLIDRIFRGQRWRDRKKYWKFHFLYIHQNAYDNSFLPARLFNSIEKNIKDQNAKNKFLTKSNQKLHVPMDGYTTIKVTIHSWDGDVMTMKGHSDFIVDEYCYSYGNYDFHSQHFGGNLSDGVMVVAPEEPYINYCLEEEKKVLIQYTLRISHEQKKQLSDLLTDLKAKAQLWNPPIITDKTATDDASRLYQKVPTKFYKFKSGIFRYYFVLNTNCIRFIQYHLNAIGFHDKFAGGLLTPGDYLDFFEKKFENPLDYDIIERQVKVKID